MPRGAATGRGALTRPALAAAAAASAARGLRFRRHRLVERREHLGVGRKRSAAFGTRSTSVRFAISTFTFAVMPGFSFSCGFGTSITVP